MGASTVSIACLRVCSLAVEQAALHGNRKEAVRQYQAAIELAGRRGFIHDQALAREGAGEFYLTTGDSSDADHYFGNAYDLYVERQPKLANFGTRISAFRV
jgi:tetratricopeptide (TPR) repeat protein